MDTTFYRNPFALRASEKIATDDTFARLFSPDSLKGIESFFKEFGLWKQVVCFQAPPGGGKTTLLRLFSPRVLRNIMRYKSDSNRKEIFKRLKSIGVCDDVSIKKCAVYLLMNRDFMSVEDGENKNKYAIGVFCALLNSRIVLSTLKTIIEMNDIEINDLDEILFCPPASVQMEFPFLKFPCTGKDLFDWAAGIENKICDSLEQIFTGNNPIPNHTSLFSIKILKAEYFKYMGKQICEEFIFQFDDIHKLSEQQRTFFISQIVETRSDISVWMAERTEALTIQDMIGKDNKKGRDYQLRKPYENATFEKITGEIADKRSDMSRYQLNLKSCLAGVLDSDYESIFQKVINNALEFIDLPFRDRFQTWFELIDSFDSLKEKAVNYYAINIFYQRIKNKGEIPLFPYSVEDFNRLISEDLKRLAYILICIKYNIPQYYGFDKLIVLGSYNIEQFIDFSSRLYDELIAKSILNRDSVRLDAKEQNNIIKKRCEELFEELVYLPKGSKIQKFLKNMVDFCRKQTTSGSASYGVVTGFAVSKNVGKYMNYDDWYKEEKFSDLAEVIRICLANNLLIPHPMTQGGKGERWLVYYLNRWLCAYINIPFDYGGWRKISLINLNKWI